MRTEKLSKADINDIVESFIQGTLSQKELAEKYHVGQAYISKLYRRKNPSTQKRISQNVKHEICALYETGLYTQRELAEAFGICQASVSQFVRGIRITSAQHSSQVRDDIKKAYAGGVSVSDLSNLYDIPVRTIRYMVSVV